MLTFEYYTYFSGQAVKLVGLNDKGETKEIFMQDEDASIFLQQIEKVEEYLFTEGLDKFDLEFNTVCQSYFNN